MIKLKMKQQSIEDIRTSSSNRQQGITLIALVITIIILLILAGIAIAALSGENGILTRGKEAKDQTQIAEIKERAKIDILQIQADNESGSLLKAQFIEILEKYFNEVPTEETLPEDLSTLILPTKAEYGNYNIKISEIWNGTFKGAQPPVKPGFDANTFTFETDPPDAKNTGKYGWKVPEYTVTTKEFTTGVWRLFYQDSNYTYLITDECVGSYKPSDYSSSYTNGADVSIIGQKLNPKVSSLFTSTNEEVNMKGIAWLTDDSVWKDYKNNDAVFAIGSPTVELFAASYNNRSNKSNIMTVDLGLFGYENNTEENWLLVDDNYGIYNKNTTSNWWLASPGHSLPSGAEAVLASYGQLASWSLSNMTLAVRPIVCIPTAVFNSNYTLEEA